MTRLRLGVSASMLAFPGGLALSFIVHPLAGLATFFFTVPYLRAPMPPYGDPDEQG